MSKTLLFAEIFQDGEDPFVLLQLILEAPPVEPETPKFVALFAILHKEVRLGNLIRVCGVPQRWRSGRVSLRVDDVEILPQCSFVALSASPLLTKACSCCGRGV